MDEINKNKIKKKVLERIRKKYRIDSYLKIVNFIIDETIKEISNSSKLNHRR